MRLFDLAVAVFTAGTVEAGMLRFACSQLVTERLDPVVNNGTVPSPHMHQVVGGNAFGPSMNGDIPGQASCTTCTFNENMSNYWTAVMYFRNRNGTFKRVPQIANQYLNGANGGMTVYYVSPDDKAVNITAFRPGFRMLVGNALARKAGQTSYVNSYRCYEAKNFVPNPMGISPNDTSEFPKKHCPGGMRVATFFPTCWDGKNLDSANHQSHVSYAFGTGCPKTHPVQIPQIFLETVWNTGAFDQSMWPTDGTQPFVWAQGDPTGYGSHADYVFGWKGEVLQKAMDARCDISGSCPQLKTQTQANANKCTLKQVVQEDLDAWLPTLPGNMPVTWS